MGGDNNGIEVHEENTVVAGRTWYLCSFKVPDGEEPYPIISTGPLSYSEIDTQRQTQSYTCVLYIFPPSSSPLPSVLLLRRHQL